MGDCLSSSLAEETSAHSCRRLDLFLEPCALCSGRSGLLVFILEKVNFGFLAKSQITSIKEPR